MQPSLHGIDFSGLTSFTPAASNNPNFNANNQVPVQPGIDFTNLRSFLQTVHPSNNNQPSNEINNQLVAVTSEKKEDKKSEGLLVIDPSQIRYFPVFVPTRGLSLYEIIMTRHPPSWSKFFSTVQREVQHACTKINEHSNVSGKAIYPIVPKVLSAFWMTPLFMLKAVIIGQDPYPSLAKGGMPNAVGASFSSERHHEIPKSLQTIYGELENSVEGWTHPHHPDLSCWGRQGVLLLNAALTVEANNPKSHVGFWTPFAEKLMDFINVECNNVVFLLWGKEAQKTAGIIYESKHKKLTAYHPSPEAENRGYMFKGCDHFNQANVYLVEKGIHPIDWRIQ